MIEYICSLVKKILIIIHKYINFKLYKNGVILYGIPKLIKRGNVKIGKNVRINDNVFIHGAGGVNINDNVTLSYGVTILSTGYDIDNWQTNKMEKIHKEQSVVIGKNVWVCANATILPGVKIEDDIIIAAGSVVTRDLKELGYIYGGVPAKKIRKLTEGEHK